MRVCLFFFKQKTAYEVRISDWSSDVCPSDLSDIVSGDLVLIEAGDRVPADLRLLHARRLLIDEALLTGESVEAEKHESVLPEETVLADRQNMAFSGTLVAAGQANGIVVATGVHTQIGRIRTLIQSVEVMATPLLTPLDQFARRFRSEQRRVGTKWV